MTQATIQPFCKKHNINVGCLGGSIINPKNPTEENIALYLHKNHFCLIWRSQDISFSKAIEELNLNFTFADICISDKHVESFIEYEEKPKKLQSHVTNMIAHDLETFKTDRAFPYTVCKY